MLDLPIGHRLARLSADRHGIVDVAQLERADVNHHAVARLVRDGFLYPEHTGVFSVGHPARSDHARWLAAVIACGEGTVLSHRSAAALWRIGASGDPTEVIAPHARRRAGILAHRSRVDPHERTVLHGIPVTTVVRTLFDVAGTEDEPVVAGAVQEAFALQLVSERTVLATLQGGRRGTPMLAAILGVGESRTRLERDFHGLVARSDLPRPERNQRLLVEGRSVEVDALWRAERVIVELDGRRFHDTPLRFERDRDRDAALLAMGWRTMRITWRQVHDDPTRVIERLACVLSRGFV